MTVEPSVMPAPVPVARSLRAGLAELAAVMPTDLTERADLLASRRAAEARATTAAAVAAAWQLGVDERTVDGAPVTVLNATAAPAARVVFVHGGGLVAGNRLDGVDVVARHAAALGLEVWTLEYPLAPEGSYDDMVDVVVRVTAAAAALGLPVILAGQSAGGGLAAAAALACRDRGIELLGQLLVCPMLTRAESVATRQFPSDASWSPRSNATAWAAALEQATTPPPGERTDLDGLAPTYLDTGSAEIFRDAIVGLAGALWAAGARAELHVWSGAFHGSDCVVESATVSVEAHRARREWLRRLLDDDV